ncbi:MAG: type I glyceraldehyde-3-phosphate dehydrogenase [Planctomycetota bacterium]|nr:MAG: type I glyceraldehyde-3-phosphate dehydrogenase [Planctomycetota bacterium]
MALRVAINGFGRIGRMVFRVLWQRRDEIEVVAINNVPYNITGLCNLLRYDSSYGRFPGRVEAQEHALVVDGVRIPVHDIPEPAKLPWGELGVDVVLESTGVFRRRAQCAQHLEAGAKRVVLSAPARDEVDATVVLGVNDAILRPEHRIVSNASCTTNCLAPVAKVLHERFGLARGLMTTVHAVTNDQALLDVVHRKDPRRGRGAAYNIVPTSTGAAKAVGLVLPELAGRLNGMAMRVPVPVGSIVDLVAETERPVTVQAVHDAMREASEGALRGILAYNDDWIVSSDIVGRSESSIYDATLTLGLGEHMVKVCSWYDNEWGYASRCADLMHKLAGFGD